MTDFSRYTVSIDYDRRLYQQDIAGSVAHAKMLAKQGIISKEDAAQIRQGLGTIEKEIREEKFPWDPDLEDLHMNIESRLHQLIGAAAGRLHTARSRNDQVAVDLRLYAKEVITETAKGLRGVQGALVGLAGRHQGVVMPCLASILAWATDPAPLRCQARVVSLVLGQATQLLGEVQGLLEILELEDPVQLGDAVLMNHLPVWHFGFQLRHLLIGHAGRVPAAGLAFLIVQSGHVGTSLRFWGN